MESCTKCRVFKFVSHQVPTRQKWYVYIQGCNPTLLPSRVEGLFDSKTTISVYLPTSYMGSHEKHHWASSTSWCVVWRNLYSVLTHTLTGLYDIHTWTKTSSTKRTTRTWHCSSISQQTHNACLRPYVIVGLVVIPYRFFTFGSLTLPFVSTGSRSRFISPTNRFGAGEHLRTPAEKLQSTMGKIWKGRSSTCLP